MGDYFNAGDVPGQGAPGESSVIRTEFKSIETAMNKLPTLTGRPDEVAIINAGGTALTSLTLTALGALLAGGGIFPTVDDAVNSGVSNPITLTHTTTGIPAAGIGTGLEYITETANSNLETGMVLEAVTTDVTGGSEDFDFAIKLMANGNPVAEAARVRSNGRLSLRLGGYYEINGTKVLDNDSLGGNILASSLTSLGTIASLVATTADINGGTIDGVTFAGGGITGAAITGGSINNTPIGAATRSTGRFTTIDASGTITGPSGQWNSGGMDLSGADRYEIGGTSVLSSSTLGAGILASSLTSVGTITSGVWLGSDIAASRLPVASTTAKGIIRIATQIEVDDGTLTNVAVTPATLPEAETVPNATTTVRGILRLATQNEVDNASNNTEAVTPETLGAKTNIIAGSVASATQSTGITQDILTQAQYDALTPDANTLYFIRG